jgi:5-methylcytosine-specific restriction enzyme B
MPQPPQITEALADATCMPRSALQEIVDLLQSQQQIVLYGPPGTGKTYLAKKPSEHIRAADDPVQPIRSHSTIFAWSASA